MSCRRVCNGQSVSPKPLLYECAADAVEWNSTTENPSLSDQGGSFFQDFGKETHLKNKLRMASCEQKCFFPLLLPISFEIRGNATRSSDPLRLEGCLLWVTWNKWKTNRKLTWGITLSKDDWTRGELACQTQSSPLLSCWTEKGNNICSSPMWLWCGVFTSLLSLIKLQLVCQYGRKPNISSIPGKSAIPCADRAKPASLRGYQVWFARLRSHSVPAWTPWSVRGVSMSKRDFFHKGVKFSPFYKDIKVVIRLQMTIISIQ